jgi:hypothetical protein
MQRREFLRSNSILFGALPFIHAERFNIFKTRFFTDDVVKIKIGKLECTVFRDYMFK